MRDGANIIITNPDMLHGGIMPNHLKWHRFFSNLKFVGLEAPELRLRRLRKTHAAAVNEPGSSPS